MPDSAIIKLSRCFALATLGVPLLLGQQNVTVPEHEIGQPYVGRFVLYSGFMFLNSPAISLFEPGVHIQAGMRWSRHVSLGFDYSRGSGDTTIGLNQATTAIQNKFGPLIPYLQQQIPGFVAALPFNSVTQTFTMGPEFPYRRFKRFTPYIRPSAGIINEVATSTTTDYLLKHIVASIAPSGKEEEWTAFYGFGGGVAINVTKHFSLIVQADFVHDHLFPDLLQNGRNTIRFSMGPGFQFGHNVTRDWGIPGHWQ
ncbi:MAG TPA: hypothetical protein VMI94_24390 [Bryobacteraceae bacterium]|nr:hypothetical protein [Bryobacteraceae bacterium]